MNLDDLGNIGEFIGALAVVVSVLYLAVQIRQNTRSLRADAHHSITSHIAELNRTIVEIPEMARILQTGLVDRAVLTTEERRRFDAYNSARFRHYDNLYYQFRAGTLEKSQWKGLENLLYVHLLEPGIIRWWQDATPFYSEEFVEYVAELQARALAAGHAQPDVGESGSRGDLW